MNFKSIQSIEPNKKHCNEEVIIPQKMHRVGSEEVSYIDSIIANNLAAPEEDRFPKSWNTISFISELEKIEVWSYKIGANLVTPRIGRNKVIPKRRLMIWTITIFLWLFTGRALICQAFIDEQRHDLLLNFGDLAAFYGKYINRFYYNTYLICWGLHAAIMYTLIARYCIYQHLNPGKIRIFYLRNANAINELF